MTKAKQLLCSLLCLLLAGSLSAQYTVTEGTGTFIDISGTGTPLGLTDDGTTTVIMPFDFTFFGTVYPAPNNVTVDNNGNLTLNDTGSGGFSNEALPSDDFGSTGLAVLWDDWDSEQGDVYWEVLGDAPNRTFIVQWEMRVPFSGATNMDPVTFQAQLDETTHRIVYFYEDVTTDDTFQDQAASATIGIQAAVGGDFVQFSFNEEGAVSDGSSIVFDDPNDDIIIIPPGVETVALAAISEINVTLNDGCMAMLVPSQILTGDFDVDGNDTFPSIEAFNIVVEDGSEENGAMIDGCGRFRWTATADTALIAGFTTAWGFINAEDKTSPVIETLPTAPGELFCSEIDGVNINLLPAAVSRCYRVNSDGSFVNPNMPNTALGQRIVAGGGFPVVTDGCSSVEICVNDILSTTDACEDRVITRVFTARDGDCPSVAEGDNAPTIASYEITFTRPTIGEVVGVPDVAEFSCEDFNANDPNPVAEANDFPYILRASGDTVFLGTSFCNLGATSSDGPRITTCANTYKFVRTYTVIDWCETDVVRTFNQLVKVGDFTAPTLTAPTQDRNFDGIADVGPLEFSTNSSDCSAFFVVPDVNPQDNCDANPTASAVVFAFQDTTSTPIGSFAVGTLAGGFPIGTHTLRYTATDDCGNTATLDVDFTVADNTAPVAQCEDGLNISIGGAGNAILRAEDIDGGSRDECSGVTLAIARVNDNDVATSPYAPTLELTCADKGNLNVGLRVTDAEGNVNFCWLEILVEDKTAPVCVAPGPITVTCADLDGEFPDDLDESGLTDEEIAALLDAEFGIANGVDNCPMTTIEVDVNDQRTSCGTGTIRRSFTVTDMEGFTSQPGSCVQVINILGVHDYTVVFPGDVENSDCIEPTRMDVTFEERGCDLITVATSLDTFFATADECFKIRVTYEVLNWCEYNTENDPYFIPRDADNDNVLTEATFLHILPNNVNTLNDDVAILDRDNNPNNGNLINELDQGDGGIRPGSSDSGYGQDLSRGAFIYQQFIKVYDETAPTLDVSFATTEFCDEDGDCEDTATLNFNITDDCSPESVSSTVTLDANINPGADGIFTLGDFVADGGDVSGSVANVGDGNFTASLGGLPIGRHAIRIVATDGCGNTAIDIIVFDILDCKAPTPICINGLTATLMPDGDGGGMAAIWASDFIASPSTDCAGEVEFTIYRSAFAAGEGDDFEPTIGDTGLVLTCADLGMLPIRIYAVDPNGQSDYCETTLFVQAFQDGVCAGSTARGTIAGIISTPNNGMMDDVEVNITDDNTMSNMNMTSNGLFTFTDLELGADYTIQPAHDPSVNLAHVSTGDLIAISRHILGLQELNHQSLELAADVTQDANINVLDIIAIRRVILGLDNTFSATASWRFYTADGAEVNNVNNLQGSITNVNFDAIEMGNVTQEVAEGRTAATLNIADQAVEAGNTYEVAVSTANAAGFQGTIEFATGLELVDVNFAGDNTVFNLNNAANGLIAVSHVGSTEAFTLTVRANTAGQLSSLISVSDRIAATEGYTATGAAQPIALNFTSTTAGFVVAQNTPNPFVESTVVRFELPAVTNVSITVQDVQGRVLMTRNLEGVAGMNSTTLTTADLKGATGIMTYTIVAGEFTATKKMVVAK